MWIAAATFCGGILSAVAQSAPTALQTVASEPEAAQSTAVAASVEATSDWLARFTNFVDVVDGWVWGVPLIGAILVTGLILTLCLRLNHIFNLKRAFRYMFHQEEGDGVSGEVSSFGALCTALSATIGTGNIVGVATAIDEYGADERHAPHPAVDDVNEVRELGQPVARGLHGRRHRGGLRGLRLGRRWKPLAVAFAFFGALAGIMGIGTIAQIHGITSAVQRFFDPKFNPADLSTGIQLFGTTYSLPVVIAGLVVTLCVGLVVIGGLKRIARVSTVIVPFMAVFYVVIIVFLLLGNLSKVTFAVELIVRAAFNPQAFTGGVVGTVFIAMQKGIARGIFSNEAGLGSAPIAAAAAKTNEPARQGLVCMTGTFIDTIVICTMTGLAIVVTGAWEPSLGLKGVDITIEAFTRGLAFLGPHSGGIASFFLMTALAFFAFTTILGWDYYSEKCLEYLVGTRRQWAVKTYRILYVAVVFVGPYLTVSVVWGIADVFNGLMAFPNLVALVLLSPVVARTTSDFLRRMRHGGAARA